MNNLTIGHLVVSVSIEAHGLDLVCIVLVTREHQLLMNLAAVDEAVLQVPVQLTEGTKAANVGDGPPAPAYRYTEVPQLWLNQLA